jgi:hypothetical protein
MNHKLDKLWQYKQDATFEDKLIKELKKSDPAKVDLSQSFFNDIHEAVMKKITSPTSVPNKKMRPQKSPNLKHIKV